jgi:aryl-alcohol dehydrogenase-like predicted oxidoreductase
MSSIPQVRLGSEGPRVSALGLGCMAMSDVYGPSDRAESIATVHAALDAGLNLLDTADFYGQGHNEMLLRETLADRKRDSYLLSVKFGALRDPSGRFLGFDGRPAAVRNFLRREPRITVHPRRAFRVRISPTT